MQFGYHAHCEELKPLAGRNGVLNFWAPDSGGYIRIERDGRWGTLAEQICEHGCLSGNTISCDGDYDRFVAICRRWARSHVRACRKI